MAASEELIQFARDLQQEIINETEAHEEDLLREEVFAQHAIDFLQEFGELDDAATCQYQKRSMKVDGYGIGQDEQTLDLIVTQCEWQVPPASITRTMLLQAARHGRGFLVECLDGLYEKMEPATPAFDLALRIHELRKELTKARIFIVTDGLCKDADVPDEDIGSIAVSYHVWDIERVFRCASSGKQREPIVIDFHELGGPLPCLSSDDDTYTSYLTIVPGPVLASIYERWGTRLLEKNVRSFLQARGKVNQGIRNTVLKEPEMFLTYNNGISVTAERAETVVTKAGGVALGRVIDFQIVNGGQTTASIFHAKRKDKADLSRVRVQMKLTVVKKAEALDEIVEQISRTANTQNKINMADFAANDPFHREVEALSRTIWAPDSSGGKRQTRWFYERARGQYLDERNRAGSPGRVRVFEATHPRAQVFTKTDLAKFENTWNQLPHVVSRGAQKNFGEFSIQVRERGGFKVDQRYFEDLVAKAIMFRQADKIIGKEGFGGYRANIVTYTLALISHLSGQRVDHHRIWLEQGLSPAFRTEVERLSRVTQQHLVEAAGSRNVTEWCKREECWKALIGKELHLKAGLEGELLAVGYGAARPQAGILGPDADDSANLESVKQIGSAVWLELSSWARVTNNLESWQRGIVYAVGNLLRQGRAPSRKQAKQALLAYETAVARGFNANKNETGLQ